MHLKQDFLIALGVVVIGGIGYLVFTSSRSPAPATENSQQGPVAEVQPTLPPPVAPAGEKPTPPPSAPVPPPSQATSIVISNFAFHPGQVTVPAGTKITWTNRDNAAHTVTNTNGAFDSRTISPGGTYSFVFKTPGTYSYRCALHPAMMGTVVVTP